MLKQLARINFVSGEVVKLYALQLLSLIKDTMGIEPKKAFKLETPYGIQMKWALRHGMPFVLHLKDKMKVSVQVNSLWIY